MVIALLVFLSVMLADVLWAIYIKATSENKTLKSSLASLMIVLVGSFTVVQYTHNPILIIPAALGAFTGTAMTIEFHKRKK